MSGSEWMLIGGMALVTFGIRYGLLALADRFTLPERAERALKYVPPAVLTAITVPAVVMPQGAPDLSWGNAYLWGALAAVGAGVVFRKHSLPASIGGGLVFFFLWRALCPGG